MKEEKGLVTKWLRSKIAAAFCGKTDFPFSRLFITEIFGISRKVSGRARTFTRSKWKFLISPPEKQRRQFRIGVEGRIEMASA